MVFSSRLLPVVWRKAEHFTTSLGTNFSRVHSPKFLGNNSYKSYATDIVNTLTFSSIYLNIICKYSCLSKSHICHITSDKTWYVPHCRLHVRHLDCMPRITETLYRFTYKTVKLVHTNQKKSQI